MTDQQLLGQRLRAAREAARMTQRDVTAKLGIDQATISRMENGTQLPDALELGRLAQLYRADVVDLLGLPFSPDALRGETGKVRRVRLLNEDSHDGARVQL